jgi:excisionase family DNA binding protein
LTTPFRDGFLDEHDGYPLSLRFLAEQTYTVQTAVNSDESQPVRHGKGAMGTTSGAQLLTRAEAAASLKVTPRFVRTLIQAGRLRAVRLGYRTIRIPSDAVQELIEATRRDVG